MGEVVLIVHIARNGPDYEYNSPQRISTWQRRVPSTEPMLRRLPTTTEQCAPVTEVTPPHGSNGSIAGSYGLANFLLIKLRTPIQLQFYFLHQEEIMCSCRVIHEYVDVHYF